MKDIIVGLLVGIAIAFLGVYFTGFSAAIAAPAKVAEILSGPSFILWEIAVIQFLGYGLVTILLLYFAVKLLKLNPWLCAVAALVACEAALFMAYSSDYSIYIPHVLVLVACAAFGTFMARRQ